MSESTTRPLTLIDVLSIQGLAEVLIKSQVQHFPEAELDGEEVHQPLYQHLGSPVGREAADISIEDTEIEDCLSFHDLDGIEDQATQFLGFLVQQKFTEAIDLLNETWKSKFQELQGKILAPPMFDIQHSMDAANKYYASLQRLLAEVQILHQAIALYQNMTG